MKGSWLLSRSGRRIDLPNPDPAEIHWPDIAESLAKQCRFLGHCEEHYSVAQHCVLASHKTRDELGPGFAIYGLLHDAHEAYLGDTIRPVKDLLGPELKKLERSVDAVIYGVASIPLPGWKIQEVIQEIDIRMLATEKRDILTPNKDRWEGLKDIKPYEDVTVQPWPWENAMGVWLREFERCDQDYRFPRRARNRK